MEQTRQDGRSADPAVTVPEQLLRRPLLAANGNFDDDFADIPVLLHSPVCLSDGVQGINAVHEGLQPRGSLSGKMGQHLVCEGSHQPLLVLRNKTPARLFPVASLTEASQSTVYKVYTDLKETPSDIFTVKRR